MGIWAQLLPDGAGKSEFVTGRVHSSINSNVESRKRSIVDSERTDIEWLRMRAECSA